MASATAAVSRCCAGRAAKPSTREASAPPSLRASRLAWASRDMAEREGARDAARPAAAATPAGPSEPRHPGHGAAVAHGVRRSRVLGLAQRQAGLLDGRPVAPAQRPYPRTDVVGAAGQGLGAVVLGLQ